MKTTLWIIISLTVIAFIYYQLIPFVKTKWLLYKTSKQIDKMANKYTGELKQQLKDIANGFRNLNKD